MLGVGQRRRLETGAGRDVANGVRNLTTHSPAGNASAAPDTAARIRRLSKVRVTARLACRLGTTSPSQRPVKGD